MIDEYDEQSEVAERLRIKVISPVPTFFNCSFILLTLKKVI